MTEVFQSILDAQNFYESLIAQLPGHIYWIDRNNVYLGCNDLQAQHAGLTHREQIRGKRNVDLPWHDQAPALDALNLQVMETGQAHTAEEEAYMLDGSRWYWSQKIPLKNAQGVVVGLLGVSIDITQRKMAEIHAQEVMQKMAQAELELHRSVVIFSGSIAHDLRSPLLSVRLSVNSMLTHLKANKPANSDSLERTLHSMQDAVHSMEHCISHTLKILNGIATSDSIRLDDLVVCHMRTEIDAILARYPFASEQERALMDTQAVLDFEFLGHSVLFSRVLNNLIKNALEAIEAHGSGSVSFATEQDARESRLLIRDTAGGVSESMQAQLFQGYWTTKKTGTGVGLAFCRLVLKSFGGNLTAEVIPNQSLILILHFPKVAHEE